MRQRAMFCSTFRAIDYGQLSKRDQEELLVGARVEVALQERRVRLRPPKPSTPDLGWDSPWGGPSGLASGMLLHDREAFGPDH